MTGLLPPPASYEVCYDAFRWKLPKRFNIAAAVCDRHAAAKPDAPAILFEDADERTQTMTFGHLQAKASQLANLMRHLGVGVDDRVAIHLPQSFAAAIAHVAVYKLGAIALPLLSLFGPDALRHRLVDSSALADHLRRQSCRT
ncbi:MAG: AMP-binding protein [Hyphomicrobiaceae bacterium]